MTERREVVVIGAGPAGTACALTLAREHGVDVLVLDRAAFPRPKACAGGLSPSARMSLEELGLWDGIVRETQHVDTVRLESDRGHPVSVFGAAEGWVIPRTRLDAAAVEAVRTAGIEVRERCKVTDVRRDEECSILTVRGPDGTRSIRALWVVVAAGAGWIMKRVGREPWVINSIIARYRGVDHGRHAIELIFDGDLHPIYGWVFAEPGGLCNVGLGIERGRRAGRSIRDVFDSFVERRLGDRMRGAEMIGRPAGLPILTSAWPRFPGTPGILLAGEAARLVNPVTGEGIAPALRSGILAGRAVGGALAGGRSPESVVVDYRASLRKHVGPSLATGQFLRVFGVPNLWWIFKYRHWLVGGRRILDGIARLGTG